MPRESAPVARVAEAGWDEDATRPHAQLDRRVVARRETPRERDQQAEGPAVEVVFADAMPRQLDGEAPRIGAGEELTGDAPPDLKQRGAARRDGNSKRALGATQSSPYTVVKLRSICVAARRAIDFEALASGPAAFGAPAARRRAPTSIRRARTGSAVPRAARAGGRIAAAPSRSTGAGRGHRSS